MTPAVPSPQTARLATKTKDGGAVAPMREPRMKTTMLAMKARAQREQRVDPPGREGEAARAEAERARGPAGVGDGVEIVRDGGHGRRDDGHVQADEGQDHGTTEHDQPEAGPGWGRSFRLGQPRCPMRARRVGCIRSSVAPWAVRAGRKRARHRLCDWELLTLQARISGSLRWP